MGDIPARSHTYEMWNTILYSMLQRVYITDCSE